MRINKRFLTISILVSALLLLGSLPIVPAHAGTFSFVVFGDSRLPGNMNFTSDQQGGGGPIDRYIRANFNAGIDDCQLRFSTDGRLKGMRIPKTGARYKDITFNGAGWPEHIIDTSRNPQEILIYAGQSWVYESVVNAVSASGSEGFILHTGDIAYNGYYGTDPATSIYWRDFKERLLDRLPKGAPAGLYGRFFPAVGNHETWLDADMRGLLTTVPYLTRLDVSSDRHIYFFDYSGSRFIFLDTGAYPPKDDWSPGSKPSFDGQMAELRQRLRDAQDKKIEHVFIALHKPPFCGAGHGHLFSAHNPHPYLVPFATDPSRPLDITVFSGHVHSTEMYFKDKIRYLVLGGGGADQVYRVNPCDTSDPYCQGERYWHGESRRMEYNYLTIAVNNADIAFKLYRWRPGSATPYQACLIDKEMNISIGPADEISFTSK